jgi:hypothetical protein
MTKSQQEFFVLFSELSSQQIENKQRQSRGFDVMNPIRNLVIKLMREMQENGLEKCKNETDRFENYFFDLKHTVEIKNEGETIEREISSTLSICFYNSGFTELRWG